jgi:NitT/TauT family transport system substrate-binding protein
VKKVNLIVTSLSTVLRRRSDSSSAASRGVSIARRLIVAAAGALVMACGGAAGASPASSPTEESHVDLRLGYYANLTHAPALVGVQRGLFTQSLGSNVTLTTSIFNAGPDAVTALLSNSIDASYVGPNPAVNAFVQSHGQAVRVVSGATSGGASLVVKPSVNSPADLKGKTLASPQLGNTQDVALRYWLQTKGLKTTPEGGGDVAIHPQDNAQTLQTFRAGQIDGAWVPEPWATRLVSQGGGKVLVDERDLWKSGRFATTLLVVRTDFLRQHPATVRRLVEGQVAADELINTQTADAQKAANDQLGQLTGGKKLTDQELTSSWAHMTFTDDPVASSLQDSANHAHQLGLLSRVELKGLFDLSILNEVLKAKGRPAVTGL